MTSRAAYAGGLVLALVLAGCGSSPAPTATATLAALPTLAAASAVASTEIPTPIAPSATATASTAIATETASPTESPTASPPPPSATQAPATPTPVPPTARPKPPPSVSLKPGQTPRPTPLTIGSLLTASIDILSLGDAAMKVTVSAKDPDTGDLTPLTTLTLQTLNRDAEPILPGLYVITFKSAAAGAQLLTCTFTAKDKDSFRFTTTDHTALVSRNREPARTAAEQLVATSSLCKP